METIISILGFLFFLWICFLPQFLGVLVYFRIKRFPKLAHLTGFFLTTILSFFFWAILFAPNPPSGEYVCGLAALAFMALVLFFTSVQILLSLIVQITLFRICKKP